MVRRYSVLLAIGVLGCGSTTKDRAAPGPASAEGGGDTGGAATDAGAGGNDAGAAGSGGYVPILGGTGGTGGTDSAIQHGGPPCEPTNGPAAAERVDLEQLYLGPNETLSSPLHVNAHGVFWTGNAIVRRVAHDGGTPVTVVAGSYDIVGSSGDILYLQHRSAGPQPDDLWSLPADAEQGTPSFVATIAITEKVFAMDAQYAYVNGGETIERAALADGTRSLVVDGLVAKVGDPVLHGDHVYFKYGQKEIARAAKSGGALEIYYSLPDLFSFAIVEDTLLIGGWQSVYSTPLAAPAGNPQSLAFISSDYTAPLTLRDGRIYYRTAYSPTIEDKFGWVSADGIECEGLFHGSFTLFDAKVWQDRVYFGWEVDYDVVISRLAIP